MTIKELHTRLEHEIKQGRSDYHIKIITDNTSMGGRASTNLKYASSGMDWESGQFNLVAEDRIIKIKGDDIDLSLEAIQLKNMSNPKNPE
jgi:hypothetical protein